MNSTQRCPQCNGPLAPTTGQPMCPACLMRGVLQPSDSEVAGESLWETQSVVEQGNWDSMRSIGATASLPDLQPDSQFGDYRIITRLGHGGMGVVYEAEHTPTSRRVALKVLAQSIDQPEAKARFMREGRLAASINHPNSVYVYGTEEIDGIPAISMELVSGGTLAQIVKTHGPLPIRRAVDAVLQIIDGLAAADHRGVLHRDVKPSNCFVASDGTVKIGDFGLSISTSGQHLHSVTDITIEGTFLGTPAFASPEQLRGEPLDRRSDIYAIGVTLFYLLTAKVPFDADNMIHLLATVLDKPAPSAASIRGEIPTDLDAIIAKCLQKPAGSRFETYESLRNALKPFSSEAPIAASLGNRSLAGMVDALICWTVLAPVNLLIWARGDLFVNPTASQTWRGILAGLLISIVVILYYAICESRYGYTPGKKLLGLRVSSGDNHPRLKQTLLRALLFILVPTLPSFVFQIATLSNDASFHAFNVQTIAAMVAGWMYYVLKFGLFATARANNGYLAIHDRVTGTRVLELAVEPDRSVTREEADEFQLDANAVMIGPYHQLQTLFQRGSEKLILGYDAKLLRRVWLHVQPIGTPSVSSAIKDSTDDSTLRWLGGRRSEFECWDCYEAPAGESLAQVARLSDGSRSVRILRRLIDLLIAREDSSKTRLPTSSSDSAAAEPGELTLHQLWTTDLDRIKVLPFSIPIDTELQATELLAPAHTKQTANAIPSIDLLHAAASRFLGATGSRLPSEQSWSIGQTEAVRKVATVGSLDDARVQLAAIDTARPLKLRPRILGMVAVSLAIPMLSVLVGIFAWLLIQRQEEQYPEIEQLHEVAQVLFHEQSKLSADRLDRLIAVERYVAGNFRELIEDKQRMNSMYGIVRIPPADRIYLEQAVGKHDPNPDELQAATEAYSKLHQEWQEAGIKRPKIQHSFWLSVGPALSWMELVWLPSLVTGLLFRGGLFLRLFGLVFVNRHGQRASGLRVFIRMLIGGLPVAAIVFLNIGLIATTSPWNLSESTIEWIARVLLGLVAATMLIVPSIRGNQCFSDRFAGTYLVAK